MADAPKRPRRFLKILGLLGLVIVLGAAGFGGYWWWQHQTPAEAASAPHVDHATASEAVVDNSGALVSFEPFLVNLSGGGGSQFLRAKVQLVIASERRAQEINEHPVALMRLRSAILELLAEQTADGLVTADGKTALKKALQEHASRIAGVPIADVLFSDFVVQF